ncbi:AAA family ATPase [Magnetococcales bacterium HHB-1]
MAHLTRFSIKKLFGFRDLDIHLKDNTLILIGENGSGKSTVLAMLYCFLSGQWLELVIHPRYHFDKLELEIDNQVYGINWKELDEIARSTHSISHMALSARVKGVAKQSNLETQHDYNLLLRQIANIDDFKGMNNDYFSAKFKNVFSSALDTLGEIRFLPTFRRVDGEFKLPSTSRGFSALSDLAHVDMDDIQTLEEHSLSKLRGLISEQLGQFSMMYLMDLIRQKYQEVDISKIMMVSDDQIEQVFSRIEAKQLPQDLRDQFKQLIQSARDRGQIKQEENTACHYFLRLLDAYEKIQNEIEWPVRKLCEVCNRYLVDSELVYDMVQIDLFIRSKITKTRLSFSQLSSGERQIIALFSQLYLNMDSNKKKIFLIIDEPELSLSLPWQERFLVDIKASGLCSGLVVATHSPFIYDNDLEKYAYGIGEFIQGEQRHD